MVDGTTERVLRLLGLLQERRTWTGPELAAELGVTDRCVRRDVMRLRDLGYPVNASQGVGGGYQLGAGTALPPLLLDADEAIATTVSLLLAAGGTVTGAADATLRTLAKLDQVLPPRLRAEVRAIAESTATLDSAAGASVDGGDLMQLARATRDRVRVRFSYAGGDGSTTERDVEPSGIVATGRRWYLLAWDPARDDWRTFRLDRLSDLTVTTWRAARPAHPDPAAYVQRTVTTAPYRHHARVRIALPPEEARRFFSAGTATVGPDPDPGWSRVEAGADDLEWLALRFAEVEATVEVLEPDGLRDAAARVAERLRAMATSGRAPSRHELTPDQHRAGTNYRPISAESARTIARSAPSRHELCRRPWTLWANTPPTYAVRITNACSHSERERTSRGPARHLPVRRHPHAVRQVQRRPGRHPPRRPGRRRGDRAPGEGS